MSILKSILNFFLLAAEEAEGEDPGCSSSTYIMLGVMVLLLVLVFVWPMISNRKKGKQVNDMRTTLRIGDEIMTIGGIVGKVVEIREISPSEKDFVIETGFGDKKSTMTFDMRALHENRTRMIELKEEAAKQAEIQRIQKEQKKQGKNSSSGYNTNANTKESLNSDANADETTAADVENK